MEGNVLDLSETNLTVVELIQQVLRVKLVRQH